jgi:hypothetical protein
MIVRILTGILVVVDAFLIGYGSYFCSELVGVVIVTVYYTVWMCWSTMMLVRIMDLSSRIRT